MMTPMRGEIWPLIRAPFIASFPSSWRCQESSLQRTRAVFRSSMCIGLTFN